MEENAITSLHAALERLKSGKVLEDFRDSLQRADPEALSVAQELLFDDELAAQARSLVVQMMLSSAAGEKRLVEALQTLPKPYQAKAFSALAWQGSEHALAHLELRAADDGVLGRVAAYAHTVVCHRLRRSAPLLTLPSSGLRLEGRAEAFATKPMCADDARLLSASHVAEPRSNVLGGSFIEGACSAGRWAFAPDARLAIEGFESALVAPIVAGVIARYDPLHNFWTSSRIVLAGPTDKGRGYVVAFRRDGVIDLFGALSTGTSRLELLAAERPGAVALEIRGYWDKQELVLAGLSGKSRVPGRDPNALRPSSSSATD